MTYTQLAEFIAASRAAPARMSDYSFVNFEHVRSVEGGLDFAERKCVWHWPELFRLHERGIQFEYNHFSHRTLANALSLRESYAQT